VDGRSPATTNGRPVPASFVALHKKLAPPRRTWVITTPAGEPSFSSRQKKTTDLLWVLPANHASAPWPRYPVSCRAVSSRYHVPILPDIIFAILGGPRPPSWSAAKFGLYDCYHPLGGPGFFWFFLRPLGGTLKRRPGRAPADGRILAWPGMSVGIRGPDGVPTRKANACGVEKRIPAANLVRTQEIVAHRGLRVTLKETADQLALGPCPAPFPDAGVASFGSRHPDGNRGVKSKTDFARLVFSVVRPFCVAGRIPIGMFMPSPPARKAHTSSKFRPSPISNHHLGGVLRQPAVAATLV